MSSKKILATALVSLGLIVSAGASFAQSSGAPSAPAANGTDTSSSNNATSSSAPVPDEQVFGFAMTGTMTAEQTTAAKNKCATDIASEPQRYSTKVHDICKTLGQ